MKTKRKAPLSAAAMNRIYGRCLIRCDGSFDRSAIMKFAYDWAKRLNVTSAHAQKHAWAVARGQLAKARAYDGARHAPACVDWSLAA
jgi:hypothetical protein